jgi:hypothetical protein
MFMGTSVTGFPGPRPRETLASRFRKNALRDQASTSDEIAPAILRENQQAVTKFLAGLADDCAQCAIVRGLSFLAQFGVANQAVRALPGFACLVLKHQRPHQKEALGAQIEPTPLDNQGMVPLVELDGYSVNGNGW